MNVICKIVMTIGFKIMFAPTVESFDVIKPDDFNNDANCITKCVIEILHTENRSKSTVMVIKNDEGIISYVINIFLDNTIPLIQADLDFIKENGTAYDGNIIVVMGLDSCKMLDDFDFTAINKNLRYLIILRDFDDECKDVMMKIGRKINQYNIDFIIKENDDFIFMTFVPEIDENSCTLKDEILPVVINKCIKGKMENNNVFPLKNTPNLKTCDLRAGIATLFPFSMYENKDSYEDYDLIPKAKGSDIAILNIIANHLNASLKYHRIYRVEENPYMQTEFLKFLLNGSLEVLAGGLYRIYGDVFAYSGIYQRQTVLWVYTAERENRSWSNFVKKVNGLYLFLLFYLFYCIVWNICCYFDGEKISPKTTVLNAWGALIGASSLQDARSLKQRTINLSYLIMSIYLSFYISVQMFSFLTIQGPPEILRTNEEIINSGRTAYLKPITKYFVQDSNYIKFANTSEDCDSFEDCEEKTLANKGLTLVIDGLFYPFQFATAVGNEARILRATESLLTVYHEMVIRKGSPIVDIFQTVVTRLFEAGICEKLYMEAIGISVVARAEEANENMMHNSYSCETGCSITLAQAAGAFYVWVIGCFVSFCIFIAEVFIRRPKTEPTLEEEHGSLDNFEIWQIE